MRLAHDCLSFSTKLLKLNFTFIVLLQLLKILLVQESHKHLLNFDGQYIRNRTLFSNCHHHHPDIDDHSHHRQREQQKQQQQKQEASIVSSSSYRISEFYGNNNNNNNNNNQPKQHLNVNFNNNNHFRNFFISLSSWYSYDVKQLEATKTDIINIITSYNNNNNNNNNKSSAAAAPANYEENSNLLRPLLVTTSFINFREILEFNDFKHLIKLAILLNLNLTSILTNLLIVSYLIIRAQRRQRSTIFQRSSSGSRGGGLWSRTYLKLNLNLNMLLFVILLAINTVYMIVINNYNQNSSKASNTMDWLGKMLNETTTSFTANTDVKKAQQLAAMPSLASFMSIFTSFSQQINYYLKGGFIQVLLVNNAKVNVFFMILTISLLFINGYMIKLESTTTTDGKRDEYDEDDDEEDYEENEPKSDDKKKSIVDLITIKQKRMERSASVDLQWIMHSLLVIYLLSVWDIADVYKYLKVKDWQSSNLDAYLKNINDGLNRDSLLRLATTQQNSSSSFLQHRLNNLIFLNKANYDYMDMNIIKSLFDDRNSFSAAANEKKKMFYLSKINNYSYQFNSNMFRQRIDYQNELEFKNGEVVDSAGGGGAIGLESPELTMLTTTTNRKLKSVTKIKVLFILKRNSQLFSDLLIICFSLIVLLKLNTFKKLRAMYKHSRFDHYNFKLNYYEISIGDSLSKAAEAKANAAALYDNNNKNKNQIKHL